MTRALLRIAIVFSVSTLAQAQTPPSSAPRVYVSAGVFAATTQVSRTEVIQPLGGAGLPDVAGMVLVQRRQHLLQQSSTQPPLLPPATVPVVEPRTEIVFTEFRSGPAVGMDLVLAVWPRFAVVPEIRMLVFGGNLDLRPGMSVRIAF